MCSQPKYGPISDNVLWRDVHVSSFSQKKLFASESGECRQVFTFVATIAVEDVLYTLIFEHGAASALCTHVAELCVDQFFFDEVVFRPFFLRLF